MFQFKNGRIYADLVPQKISFVIPEGFWIDTDPPTVNDYSIALLSPDKTIRVDFQVWESEKEEVTDELQEYEGSQPVAIRVGDLDGYYVLCRDDRRVSVEIQADMIGLGSTDGRIFDRVRVLLYTKECGNPLERDEVRKVLNSVRVG